MLRKLFYVFKIARQRGLGFFVTYFRESVLFDLKNDTSTSSRVPKDQQTIDSSGQEQGNGLLYVASFTSVTRKSVAIAKSLLGPERFADSQFFDLGCGKGKPLMVYAMEHGDKTSHPAIGIEYDPQLAEMARANVAKSGVTTIEIKTDSATNLLEYAQADTLLIYLYNSFQGETLRTVLETLADTPHILIYVDPAERDVLSNYDYKVHHDVAGQFNADTWLVASRGLDLPAS